MITKTERRITAILLAMIMCFSVVSLGSVTVSAEEASGPEAQAAIAGTEMETQIDGSGEQKMYVFTPEESGTYRFYSAGDEDTYGYVYDEAMNLIASDNDGGDGFNFSVEIALESGKEYYLSAAYFLEGETGTIRWMVEPVAEVQEADAVVTEDAEGAEKTEEAETTAETTKAAATEEQSPVVSGDYEYKILEDDTAEITKYTGSAAEVSVPDSIDGKKVTSVGKEAFIENENITKVTIPNTVTQLQYQSFANCENLADVSFASGSQLQTIGAGAFYGCSGLEKMVCPDSLQTIEKNAFARCEAMTEIQFGSGIRTLGDYSFYWSGLVSVDIKDSITEVGEYAFCFCESLKNVSLGKGITEIKEGTFESCTNLKSVQIPDNIESIGNWAFNGSGLESIVIPDSVKSIGEWAFRDCSDLMSAVIGNGLTYVAESAFASTGLENITIGNKVKSLGDYSFEDNTKLQTITIPSNVTELEYAVFKDCTSLSVIELPDTLEKIGGRTFQNTAWYEKQSDGVVYANKVLYTYKGEMPKNTTVEIQEGTLGVAGFAFENCQNLAGVSIPDGMTNIGDFAFYDCSSMTSISIPDSVKEIGTMAVGLKETDRESGTHFVGEQSVFGYYEVIPGFVIYGEADSAAETYAAKYEIEFVKNKHTVTFADGNTVISTQEITSGEDAAAPANPTKDGYVFIGWSGDYTNVKSDVDVQAKWKASDGWIEKSDGCYYYEDGKMVTGWKQVGSNWYYMYEDGLMAADAWIGEYYVNADGEWVSNLRPAKWIKSSNGKWWYRNEDGSYPAKCWKQIDGEWYYFDASGYMATNWLLLGNTWYYLGSDGAMRTGWTTVSGNKYYLRDSGAMAAGWLALDDTWYYMGGSGALQTGWAYVGGKWYYLEPGSGAMAVGKKTVGNETYYLSSSGAMVTGWNNEDGTWYYYKSSGAMATGWTRLGNTWYYLNPSDGSMFESQWLNNTYYLTASGAMATGWYKMEGEYYYFTSNGDKVVSKWVGNYYLKADGVMAKDEWVDQGKYYVDATGKWVPNKAK